MSDDCQKDNVLKNGIYWGEGKCCKTELMKTDLNGFERKEFVRFEPWMKRGAKVITPHGKGKISYVRKNMKEVLNFYVNIYSNEFQYQRYLCSAWAVKQDLSE